MKVFALQGGASRELISYHGLVLIHDNRAEMEWLFPMMDVVEVTIIEGTMAYGSLKDGRATMSIKDHPQFEGVSWNPLRKEDFSGFSR